MNTLLTLRALLAPKAIPTTGTVVNISGNIVTVATTSGAVTVTKGGFPLALSDSVQFNSTQVTAQLMKDSNLPIYEV